MTDAIRVVFMGTPDFAVPVLHALVQAEGIEVVGVVTQPDKEVGRKRALTPTPVKLAALKHGLPVLQPRKVRAEASLQELMNLRPDVLVTAAYGQLLPQALLDIPPHGCLNVHASLLPRWRGAAPIHRAILAGDEETGVTIMKTVLAMDEGPILSVCKTPIHGDDNVGTLHERLAQIGAEALVEVLPGYVMGQIHPHSQPKEGITYANRILRNDEYIRWNATVREVDCHIRGLCPWPVACTVWNGSTFKVWKATPLSHVQSFAQPGTVRQLPGHGLCVRCADGWVRLDEVQPAGKRKMAGMDWFRGLQTDETSFSNVENPA